MGRKTKLTRKLIDKLACHVANGHTIKTSAALCGLSERSIYNWFELASNDAIWQVYLFYFCSQNGGSKIPIYRRTSGTCYRGIKGRSQIQPMAAGAQSP